MQRRSGEQEGFRTECSTTEQITNLRILYERYLQHQQNLNHVFVDFKRASDRVWHAALCATLQHKRQPDQHHATTI